MGEKIVEKEFRCQHRGPNEKQTQEQKKIILAGKGREREKKRKLLGHAIHILTVYTLYKADTDIEKYIPCTHTTIWNKHKRNKLAQNEKM